MALSKGEDGGETRPIVDSASTRGVTFDEPVFRPDDMVAGRYRITRFVAVGGMGEVYEAEDTVLSDRVALKTIRADVADDNTIVERFKREIQLARRVTHPNVCRIFDVGFHESQKRAQLFFTMELLHGETLSQRLKSGRLSIDDARPLVEQMIAGLDAAHKEGIVHRDFKSSNVMLVARDGEGPRVVLTDFGLARGRGGDIYATKVGEGELMGSPAYMAPEQVEGDAITPAADIYALGVVMYEMVTGTVPFTGESRMSVAMRRLSRPAPSPRTHIPSLDGKWERTILRCLEREPRDRFPDVLGILRGLDGGSVGLTRREVVAKQKQRQWVYLAIGGAALVALAAFGAVKLFGGKGPTKETAAEAVSPEDSEPVKRARPDRSGRTAVAVVGFQNVSGRQDLAWLSVALSEMLTTELADGGTLRTIPGESVVRMKKELALADGMGFAPDTLEKLHETLGADYVIVGGYVPAGDKVRFDLRLQDTATGETILDLAEVGTDADLGEVARRAGKALRGKLSADAKESPREGTMVAAALPSDPGAARYYSEGLSKLREYEALEAKNLLEKSIALEPDFAPSHAALSRAVGYLGYEPRAVEEAKRAMELARSLPEEQRLAIEAQYHRVHHDVEKALPIYQKLFETHPDDIEWGLNLAGAQMGSGREPDARVTLDAVRALPGAASDPRVRLYMMYSAMHEQDYDGILESAAVLIDQGTAQGTLPLVAEARGEQAVVHWFKGNLDDALESSDEAKRLTAALGDQDGVTSSLTTAGFLHLERGEYTAALARTDEALAIVDRIGNRRRLWLIHYVRALATMWRGELDTALVEYEKAEKTAAEINSLYGQALAYLGMASTLHKQGKPTEARPMYEKVLLGFRRFAPKHNTAIQLQSLADVMASEGEVTSARRHLEDSLKLREEIGEVVNAARSRTALAELTLYDGGDAAAAERQAREALSVFERQGVSADRAWALGVIARALVAQKDVAKAKETAAQAVELAKSSENLFVRLGAALALGTALGASEDKKDLAEAKRVLEEAHAEAAQAGANGDALELEVVIAELDARRGDGGVKKRAVKIAERARAAGYRLLAERADAVGR